MKAEHNSEMGLYQAIRNDRRFLGLLLGVALSLVFEFSSLLHMESSEPVRLFISVVLILTLGRKVLRQGLKALAQLNFKSINLLMTLAAIGAFWLREYEEACVIIILYTLAERLEDYGFDQSKSTIQKMMSQIPQKTRLAPSLAEISVSELVVNQEILIRPGEMIPIDGVIASGTSLVDETSITGEPMPQEKTTGDLVFAGSLNQQGALVIRVLKKLKESTLAQVVELTLTANAQKSETEVFIRKFTSRYTPTVMVLTILVMILPPWILSDANAASSADLWIKWFRQGLSLLVISCPCALIISTPLSIYAAMTNAAKHGLMIKGGKYLEMMAHIKQMAFDKTRTITLGVPEVAEVVSFSHLSSDQILACAAGLESHSEHPLARSLMRTAQAQQLTPHTPSHFKSEAGLGISSDCLTCNDGIHFLGRPEYIEKQFRLTSLVQERISSMKKSGQTVVLVASSQGPQGAISFSDTLKPGSPQVIEKLKKLGIQSLILSGDHQSSVEKMAKLAGIEKYYGDLLPADKLRLVKDLGSEQRKMAMVGDGLNDAPALAQAHVSIAMGAAGNDTAIETAKISILNDNLDLIPGLVVLARKTLSTIKFNTWLAVSVKFIFLILALTGHGQLFLAIIADVGLTLIVILNSLRLSSCSLEIK